MRRLFCQWEYNIVSDVTNHFSQFCILKSAVEIAQPKKITTRDYSKFSQHAFLRELSNLTLDSTLSAKDPSMSFSTFYNKLNKLLDKHAPLRTLSKRKSKQLANPWITEGLRKAIKIKMSFFTLATEKDKNFIEIKCCHFLLSAKEVIIIPILN